MEVLKGKLMRAKRGFTLAEVLITLTVIGVIAAITIPSLVTNLDIDRKQADAVIKKTYTTFNDATKQIVMLETTAHTMASVGCSDSNCIRDLYGKYIAYIKTCNSDAQTNCLDGAPATSENPTTTMLVQPVWAAPSGKIGIGFDSKSLAVLADGTLVGFEYDSTCQMTVESLISYKETPVDIEKACVAIAVDVNNAKKPNAEGRDRYQFAIGKLGVKFKATANTVSP